MITDVTASKLVVISDLHLGNPFSRAKQPTMDFLRWCARNKYDIVINGDGFEIAQVSFAKIARDVPEVFHALKSVTAAGRNVYYVVGNHDIVLENFLNDWGGFKVAPFLNVWSGTTRLRIEHGHLYDPFFVRNPELYEFFTWLAGFALHIHPALYKMWIKFEKIKSRFFEPQEKGILGEHPNFSEAAQELLNRGFDAVVFGHTHHVGQVDFGNGQIYMNPGSWLMGTSFVQITDGQLIMRQFDTTAKAFAG